MSKSRTLAFSYAYQVPVTFDLDENDWPIPGSYRVGKPTFDNDGSLHSEAAGYAWDDDADEWVREVPGYWDALGPAEDVANRVEALFEQLGSE